MELNRTRMSRYWVRINEMGTVDMGQQNNRDNGPQATAAPFWQPHLQKCSLKSMEHISAGLGLKNPVQTRAPSCKRRLFESPRIGLKL